MKKECSDMKKENADLRASHEALALELATLKARVHEDSLRITAQDQYSRKKNLEIKGVPQNDKESLIEVLSKVGEAIGEPITEQDVEICHRVPVRNDSSDPNIVVVFQRQQKRDAVIRKAQKARFNTEDLGFASKQPVYVNEHLCPKLKKLLGMTIAKKRELNWRFAWSIGGKVFARKTESSRAIQITCEADLGKMRDTTPVPSRPLPRDTTPVPSTPCG
ncbi:hypothetical protein HPB48_015200 [Haemaphysalis longicornis]|uniref:FP protein C-terminal domain-containing protein n=1 Tax=Haemaphysalis longicornis TaxID=44386 RepID=A0A9J6FIK2_HAELO|nr:hypothetical protein HPB48_015200 [Haemaphysalis longicornis]